MYNAAAPEGKEYLLVKIHVKSTYSDSEEHNISVCDFSVTGDRLHVSTCGQAGVIEPEPRLDATLYTGGEAEGWGAYLVEQGEGNLMLVVRELFSLSDDATRYVALDEGASIVVSPDLGSIQATDLGKERSNPAPSTQKVVTEDWEISILEIIRGADAWAMVQTANQFNDPPAEGMEYIVVKVHVRYIGTEEKTDTITSYSFTTTGSAGVVYDSLFVVPPDPALEMTVFPGGEYEGWIVQQAAVSGTGVMLVYDPAWDFSGMNKRFISLEP